MSVKKGTGISVELYTFEKYGKSAIIGHKTIDKDNKILVNFIWCKLCAKHKTVILSNPSCKGSARTAAEAYISGTNSVSKWNIDRHLQSKFFTSFYENIYLYPTIAAKFLILHSFVNERTSIIFVTFQFNVSKTC